MIYCVTCPECGGVLYRQRIDTSSEPDKVNIQIIFGHERSDREIDNTENVCCYWITELEAIRSVINAS